MEIPATLALKIGETYTLRLPGLGTAGYRWTYAIEGDVTAIEVSTAVSTVEAEHQPPLSVGSSQDEVFVLRALAAGHLSMRFEQRRLWETNQLPLKQHIIRIEITA